MVCADLRRLDQGALFRGRKLPGNIGRLDSLAQPAAISIRMNQQTQTLLTYGEVQRRLACSRVKLWAMVRDGEFPEPLRLGRSRRWRKRNADVNNWTYSMAAMRPNGNPGSMG